MLLALLVYHLAISFDNRFPVCTCLNCVRRRHAYLSSMAPFKVCYNLDMNKLSKSKKNKTHCSMSYLIAKQLVESLKKSLHKWPVNLFITKQTRHNSPLSQLHVSC